MFAKTVAALDELPESQHALRAANDLSCACNAELATVFTPGNPPAYTSLSIVVDSGASAATVGEQQNRHKEMHEQAANVARKRGVHAQGSVGVANEVCAILSFLKEQNTDLLVVGLHQHDFYSCRLWNSVCYLAQDATCSVLGVH
jgi:nucleotide-binding universal stress UspA family protein